jgi:hypothetical protein
VESTAARERADEAEARRRLYGGPSRDVEAIKWLLAGRPRRHQGESHPTP